MTSNKGHIVLLLLLSWSFYSRTQCTVYLVPSFTAGIREPKHIPFKYVGPRIQYYDNSTSTFQSLVQCGDIDPNPGPTTQDSIHQYSSRYFHSVRAKCDKLKVPPPTWNIIKTLGLNIKPSTRRGHRGGLKTHRNAVNLQHPIIHNNNNVNNEKIDVLIRPRLPTAPSFQEKSALRLQSRCLTKVTITTTARPKKS